MPPSRGCSILLLASSLFLVAADPGDEPRQGAHYIGTELRARSPGPEWVMQDSVPGAPGLHGAFMLSRGPKKSTLITFAVDATPTPPEPARYVREAFEILMKPPIGMKPLKKSPFKWKEQEGFRVEYTDRDGVRHFAQAAVRTPRGGILVVNLQSPDATTYKQDLPTFVKFLDGVDLPGRR